MLAVVWREPVPFFNRRLRQHHLVQTLTRRHRTSQHAGLVLNEQGENAFGIHVGSLLVRVQTVRVETEVDDPISTNNKRLHALCDAALFHVAYGWGLGISLSISWERAYYRLGLRRKESVQFPLRTYNSGLLSYYHLAFGSDSLILAYLALYKILEYFFTSASEGLLHSKMSEKLVEPDFLHTKPKKLRELVKTIRAHDSRMDEKRSSL